MGSDICRSRILRTWWMVALVSLLALRIAPQKHIKVPLDLNFPFLNYKWTKTPKSLRKEMVGSIYIK